MYLSRQVITNEQLLSNKKSNLSQFTIEKKILFRTYCLFIIFICSATNEFANSIYSQLIFILFSFLLLPRNKKFYYDKFSIWFISLYLLIEAFHFASAGFMYLGSIKYLAMLVCIYFMIKKYSFVFTDTLFTIIYYLTILSLPLFALHLVNPAVIKSLLSPFNIAFATQRDYGGIYVFLYNINPFDNAGALRNSGFMWEPGAFGGMIIFTIIYLFIRNGIVVNKKILLLAVCAITTLSTTTFYGLMVLLFVLILKKLNLITLIIALPLIAVLFFQVNQLSFMNEKIDSYFKENTDYKGVYNQSFFADKQSIGRFAGIMIELENFKKSPIIGTGWQTDYSNLGMKQDDWSNPNGLAVILGKFGLSGIIFILVGLFYFFKINNKLHLVEITCLIITTLMPLFSNPFQLNIVFWLFIFAGYNANLSKIKIV